MRASLGVLLGLTLLNLLSGCAHLKGDVEPSPSERYRDGIAAWQEGDHERAALLLGMTAASERETVLGESALLLLTALELDPRNTTGTPAQAALLADELIAGPRVSASTARIGEVFHLLAQELGAPPPSDSSGSPRLLGEPLAARLDHLQAEHDRQRQELGRIQRELRSKDEEIEQLRRELERIRKTLRP